MLSKSLCSLATIGLLVGSLNVAQAQNTKTTKDVATTKDTKKTKDSVTRVNGVVIPQSRFDFVMRERIAQGQPDDPQVREGIREDLIMREVISQAATKKELQKKLEVQTQLELSRQNILVRAYLQDYLKTHPASEASLKKEYEQMKTQLGDKEYKAKHILVDKEEEAKAIIEQLNKGAKFADLAADKSKDSGSKTKGGELDWTVPSSYVPPFAEALVKLEKGKYTLAPIQSQFGWHVIQLDDIRNTEAPPFEQVKASLEKRAQQQQIDKLLDELRAKAKIE